MTSLMLLLGIARMASAQDDDLARYVWQKAQLQMTESQVAATGQRVVGIIRAEFVRYDKKRHVIQKDSARGEVFGKDGVLDSFQITTGNPKLLRQRTLSWPDLSNINYRASTFPNDTGGEVVSINFDLDTARALLPVGIINVNRINYYPVSVYLSLPVDVNARRRSQRIVPIELAGALYPSELTEIVVEKGILSEENYQLKIWIDSLRLR